MITNKLQWRHAALLCMVAAAPAAAAQDSRYTVMAGADFSSGKYGSSDSTDIWFLPVVLKYEQGPSTFKMTVPYVRVSAPSGGTLVGYDDQGLPIYSGKGARTTEEGLGDVILSYSRSLIEPHQGGFLVDLGGRVKLPTADKAKGLGSGKTDYGAFADLYYLGRATMPFATLEYRVLGEPAGVELRNVWKATLGLAYTLSPRNSVGAMWDLRQASRTGGSGMNELTAYWASKLGDGYKLQVYGVKGFSAGSPDYGVGVMVGMTSR